MQLSREVVEHVARLAHVGLGVDEIEHYADELSSVLEHVARLQELDTSGVEATAYVLPVENVLRDDVVEPSLAPDAVLANAPRRTRDQFEVQAIFE